MLASATKMGQRSGPRWPPQRRGYLCCLRCADLARLLLGAAPAVLDRSKAFVDTGTALCLSAFIIGRPRLRHSTHVPGQ